MEQSAKEAKKSIRASMLRMRDDFSRRLRNEYSRNICLQLWNLVEEKNVRCIHTYLPMGSEINIVPLIRKALDHNLTVVVPKTLRKRQLENLVLKDLNNMEPGIFGTYHPKNAEVYTGAFDLIVVAGLAFDRMGNRVGYGGGYYDTFLAGQPRAFKAGVCFPFQMLESLPVEPHDVPLDLVCKA